MSKIRGTINFPDVPVGNLLSDDGTFIAPITGYVTLTTDQTISGLKTFSNIDGVLTSKVTALPAAPASEGSDIAVRGSDATSGHGGDVSILGGGGSGASNSGGHISIIGGGGGGTGGPGGNVNIYGGVGGLTNSNGGHVTLLGGLKTGTGTYGKVRIGKEGFAAETATLDADGLSVSRVYTFPDKSGTFAMLDDITGGVSDGDKGDIVVSGAGTVYTIDTDVVTFAKMQNIATDKLLGRVSASSGDVEEITFTDFAQTLIDDVDAATARATLGLGSVENTALSSWPGSANITTLGTIATGVWQGSIIGPTFLGTGTSITTKFLRGDGTWQTIAGGGDLLAANNLSELTNFATARSNLGLTIGSAVQAHSAVLDDVAVTLISETNAYAIRDGWNSPIQFTLDNTGSGTFAEAIFSAQSDSSRIDVRCLSGNYTVTGDLAVADGIVEGTSRLVLTGGSSVVFATNPTYTERARITQGLMVGTTTDPGAGVINVATGFRIGNAAASNNFLMGDGTNFVSTSAASAKTGIGLGNVENTALSTWAGSANITTLGTIGTGVWQGTIIGPTFLGTGTSITTKFLRGDGTWQTVSGGGGITNSAGADVIMKSDGTNAVASSLTDDGVTITGTVPFDGITFQNAFADNIQFLGTNNFPNMGFRLLESGGTPTHYLTVSPGSVLSADRTFTLTTGDANRNLTLGGDTTLNGGTHSGTNTGDQTITLTGEVTGSGTGSFAATIADNAVTYAKMQNVSATDRLLGRDTAAAGDVEELTVSGGIEFTGSGGIQTSAFTGDATKTAGGTALTLATVNSNVGSFKGANVTVNGKGLVTAAAAGIFSKSIAIESPTSSENISLFHSDEALTIVKIVAVLRGSGSPSVTWTVRKGADRSASGTEVVTGGTTTTSTTTGSVVTSFNSAGISANDFIWITTTAQSGTVPEISLTVYYTKN